MRGMCGLNILQRTMISIYNNRFNPFKMAKTILWKDFMRDLRVDSVSSWIGGGSLMQGAATLRHYYQSLLNYKINFGLGQVNNTKISKLAQHKQM